MSQAYSDTELPVNEYVSVTELIGESTLASQGSHGHSLFERLLCLLVSVVKGDGSVIPISYPPLSNLEDLGSCLSMIINIIVALKETKTNQTQFSLHQGQGHQGLRQLILDQMVASTPS